MKDRIITALNKTVQRIATSPSVSLSSAAADQQEALQLVLDLTGKVVVDKGHLRLLLLSITSDASPSTLDDLIHARNLFPGTNTIDTLLRDLNAEG